MGEPCLCGATDCKKCFRYILIRTCVECGEEFSLENKMDEATVCYECREKEGEG